MHRILFPVLALLLAAGGSAHTLSATQPEAKPVSPLLTPVSVSTPAESLNSTCEECNIYNFMECPWSPDDPNSCTCGWVWCGEERGWTCGMWLM